MPAPVKATMRSQLMIHRAIASMCCSLVMVFAVKRTQLYLLDDRPRDLAARPRVLDLPDVLTQVFRG